MKRRLEKSVTTFYTEEGAKRFSNTDYFKSLYDPVLSTGRRSLGRNASLEHFSRISPAKDGFTFIKIRIVFDLYDKVIEKAL